MSFSASVSIGDNINFMQVFSNLMSRWAMFIRCSASMICTTFSTKSAIKVLVESQVVAACIA